MNNLINTQVLPMMPLLELVVFPGNNVSFDAVRQKTVKALDEAMRGSKLVFLVTQRNMAKEPSFLDLYKVGTIAKINQTIRLQNGIVRIMAEGLCRGRISEILTENPHMTALIERIEEDASDSVILDKGYMFALEKLFKEYSVLTKNASQINFAQLSEKMPLGNFTDMLASNLQLNYKVKQDILEEADVYNRVERLMSALSEGTQVLKIAKDIEEKVKRKIDENQREYYLREELKVIENELGEKEGIKGEADEYRKKLSTLGLEKDTREKLEKDISRFEKMQSSSPDSAVMRNYLDLVLSLPWKISSEECKDILKVREILNNDHYGMEKVKKRVLEYLAVRIMSGKKGGPILCLAGPPGTGKTSVAKSIARALERKYVRISLGGIHDEADIRGHRKTYVGAMPGRIISAIAEAGTKNPLILLDEIDKMGCDYKGDPSAALLEVLDSEQNFSFRDHFAEVPFDLSDVLFVTTANTVSTIPAPLLDRIEIIEVSGYTNEEKKCIARQYLIPKQLEKNGLTKEQFSITEKGLSDLINYYTRESGVRHLERELGSIMRKMALDRLENGEKAVKRVTGKNLTDILGKRKYNFDNIDKRDEVGIVRGLAWTSVGGDTLSVEANIMPGTGNLELTGNLGDVMKESAMAAISFIRTKCGDLGVYEKFYKTCDIHIHVPEGAVPKDGPSAGITIATAIASALTGHPVKRTVAMTGEITLRGKVLPIGGLKEKSAAAYRAGIKTVIIPKENLPDLEEISEEVRGSINFEPVSDMGEVLDIALCPEKREYFDIPVDKEDSK